MTKKVKVTREQATAFEYLRDTKFHDEGIIASHARTPMGWVANYTESLNGMPLLTLVDALRIGYEVEEEYKPGDWVVIIEEHESKEKVLQVKIVSDGLLNLDYGNGYQSWWPVSSLRHATPEEIKSEKERRVWAKIGRKSGEFRVGDGYLYNTGALYTIDCEQRIRVAREAYDGDKLLGFYPAEFFIEFGGGE